MDQREDPRRLPADVEYHRHKFSGVLHICKEQESFTDRLRCGRALSEQYEAVQGLVSSEWPQCNVCFLRERA